MTTSRQEKKAKTRAALINAALELVEERGNFSSVSIREITRKAGVVPTSFYRHFNDVSDLGLNIVDEVGISLRKIIRSGRQADLTGGQMIKKSLQVYVDYIEEHRDLFIFTFQGRTGGPKNVRDAIRSEFRFFTLELVNDLTRLNLLPNIPTADLEMIADLVVNTVAFGTVDLLDADITPQARKEIIKRTEQQMRIIFMGASLWQPK